MTRDHMGFVGVSTAASSINVVFPLWAEILDLPTDRLIGHDLPLDATRAQYRELVARIRDDPHHRGALVTTHKMNVYAAAADMFDDLDPFAVSCREISSISKRGDTIVGQAKDPVTVALALDDALPREHFARTGGEVLILGAGGSGTALSWALAERDPADRPTRITVTARTDRALDELRAVHDGRGTPADLIVYRRVDEDAESAALVAALPDSSLVVNATGLGKDRPGSPLPDGVCFPRDGWAWEFNYRGSLEFLHQARAQEADRGLHVVDGWRYFIHGWSQVVADVFDLRLTPAVVEELARAAETTR
ncbi:saccharopine dehydrogenase NADP-binding domain-containing protein [Microbacterium sp. ABRD28]|uniref:shikimate dehydrogenase family protein n=1 Tax=Microbacterium sp. ABRD28 TaxID=2268461 RepID=UPI000F552046|nr:saccharopine dehydrogenase NADP-binding domain-containing protein [Microbacterium sp. ABRD28]AZC12652.1 shikimate dehydrogenase [Microbacterium sp. ABRD28]